MYLYDCYYLIVCRLVLMSYYYVYAAVVVTTESNSNHNNQQQQRHKSSTVLPSPYRHRRRMIVFSPETYPLPGSQYCAHDYLKLMYVCDPHLWLGHTDALKLNKSLNYKKFSYCTAPPNHHDYDWSNNNHFFYRPTMPPATWPDGNVYSLGVALASTIQTANVDECPSADLLETRSVDAHTYERFVKNNLLDIAKMLRRRWTSNGNNGCARDILILFVRSLITCINNRLVTFHSDYPMMAVSFSQRVLTSLSEDSAMGLEKSGFQMLYADQQTSTGSALYCILRIFSILDAALPPPATNGDSPDLWRVKQSPSSSTKLLMNTPFPKHTIPTWALIAFMVSASVTLLCTIIGHWVNTSGSRSKFYSADRFPFARSHHGNRRWRAGFAGGMMELHNSGQPGQQSSGRSYSQVGLKPGVGRTKSKMFGAMSMHNSNKRGNFNPQYNYQRV